MVEPAFLALTEGPAAAIINKYGQVSVPSGPIKNPPSASLITPAHLLGFKKGK
jgi:hypothetical protein